MQEDQRRKQHPGRAGREPCADISGYCIAALSKAATIAANRASTSGRRSGCVNTYSSLFLDGIQNLATFEGSMPDGTSCDNRANEAFSVGAAVRVRSSLWSVALAANKAGIHYAHSDPKRLKL